MTSEQLKRLIRDSEPAEPIPTPIMTYKVEIPRPDRWEEADRLRNYVELELSRIPDDLKRAEVMLTILRDLDTLYHNARKAMYDRLPEDCVDYLLPIGI